MLNATITYNPYFVKTDIEIDGEAIQTTSRLFEMCRHERLQNWIDKFLVELYEEHRDKHVVINFKGTELDADDLRNAIKDYNDKNPGFNFSVGKVESKPTGAHRVAALKKLFDEGKQGPFSSTFQSADMQAAFDRALDPTFEVNVIATMSSGKSTLVNALLGKELLPAKNEACTATIARIQDDDSAPLFTAQRFDKHGKALSDIKEASNTLLSAWNEDSQTSRIEVKGNIPTVQQTDECTMVFVDTPGPNNSRNEDHRRITLEAIKSKPLSMILYILNSTQLSTKDDCSLLDQVCETMSAGGRQAQDRFIFIANKIDAFDPEKGESVTRALKNVKNYLQDQDSQGNIRGIENPLIIPVSAQLAKLLRIKRNGGNLTRSEKGDYAKFVDLFVQEPEMNMVEHVKHRLNGDCVRRLQDRIDKAKGNDEELAEIFSGIPIVEELLNDFLQKHAMPAKLKDAVDSFEQVMQEAKIAEKMNEQLAKSDKEIQDAIKKIQDFQDDKKRIEMGLEFRKKISAIKYSLSTETKNIIEKIIQDQENVLSNLRELLSDPKIPGREANHAIDEAIQKCNAFDTDVIVILRKALRDEYFGVMKNLRNEYQNYVESVLKETFPQDTTLRELQAVSMTMPSVTDLVQKHTETIEEYDHSETEGIWENWNFIKLNWTEASRTKDIYVDRDYVKLKAIGDEINSLLRSNIQEKINSFKKLASENVDTAKRTLLKVMDLVDVKVKEVQDQLIAMQNDKSKKEAIRAENQKKLDWFNDFRSRLQDILSV